MPVSSRKQFTLRIVAKGDSEKLAMADLFDELKVVSVEYHLMGMKGLDDELRRREKELDRMQAELKTAKEQLFRLTDGHPMPRCGKIDVVRAICGLRDAKYVDSNVISLLDIKNAIDNVW